MVVDLPLINERLGPDECTTHTQRINTSGRRKGGISKQRHARPQARTRSPPPGTQSAAGRPSFRFSKHEQPDGSMGRWLGLGAAGGGGRRKPSLVGYGMRPPAAATDTTSNTCVRCIGVGLLGLINRSSCRAEMHECMNAGKAQSSQAMHTPIESSVISSSLLQPAASAVCAGRYRSTAN